MSGEGVDESAWRRLDAFRNEIDRIDERILTLLTRRQAAAQGIGEAKRTLNLDIVDPARERRVLERLSDCARDFLDPEAIRTVYAGIIAAARKVQETRGIRHPGPDETSGLLEDRRPPEGSAGRDRASDSRPPEGQAMIQPRAKVGIIGGTGRMGSWLAGILEQSGHPVLKVGRRTRMGPEDAARSCDVVVISIPVEKTLRMIQRIGPLVPKDALLMDLTSVKQAPVKSMLQHSRSQVVGVHPLFGPRAGGGDGPFTVAVCRGRGESGLCWIRDRLQDQGYCVKEIGPAEHDRIMGVVQGANHFATLAFALFLSRSGLSHDVLERWSTPAFRSVLQRIHALLSQPDELVQGLLQGNAAAPSCVTQYGRAVEDAEEILEGKNPGGWGDLLDHLRDQLKTGQNQGGHHERHLGSGGSLGS